MTRKPSKRTAAAKGNRARVSRFYQAVRESGGGVVTVTLRAEAIAALSRIQARCEITRREAVERAILAYEPEPSPEPSPEPFRVP